MKVTDEQIEAIRYQWGGFCKERLVENDWCAEDEADVIAVLLQALGERDATIAELRAKFATVDREAFDVLWANNQSLKDELAELRKPVSAQSYGPTLAAHINALPPLMKRYVHDLETRADPSGDLRDARLAQDTAQALEIHVQELEAEVAELRKPVAVDSELSQAFDNLEALVSFAYEMGFHEMGYCPLKSVRTAYDAAAQDNARWHSARDTWQAETARQVALKQEMIGRLRAKRDQLRETVAAFERANALSARAMVDLAKQADAAESRSRQLEKAIQTGTASMYAQQRGWAVTEQWMQGFNACKDAIDYALAASPGPVEKPQIVAVDHEGKPVHALPSAPVESDRERELQFTLDALVAAGHVTQGKIDQARAISLALPQQKQQESQPIADWCESCSRKPADCDCPSPQLVFIGHRGKQRERELRQQQALNCEVDDRCDTYPDCDCGYVDDALALQQQKQQESGNG